MNRRGEKAICVPYIILRIVFFVERHSFGQLVGLNYRRATEFGPFNVFHPIRFAAWKSDACHE